jgi:peptidylprolyl isomerase
MAFAAVTLSTFTACNNGVTINGEKVELTDGIYAKFETSKGDILIELDVAKAPMTAGNFIALAEGTMPTVSEEMKGKPFYDGLKFHRVIPEFMIQGGDPEGTGNGGPGYEFPNEVSPDLTHNKGVISMANSGPNTNGSQFFITVGEPHFLDGGYSVFGKVLEGQSIADTIATLGDPQSGAPSEDIIMNKVTIIRVGSEFKEWDAVAAFEKGKTAFDEAQKVAQQEAAERAQQQEAIILEQYKDAQKSSTGLMYIIEEVGKGKKPNNNDTVYVNYAGFFADGRVFDSNIQAVAEANEMFDPNRPYEPMPAIYGPQAPMIPGFAEGLSLLNYGGKAKLIIPPHLAYGERGAGEVIPPNSWLIFDIELVNKK